MEREISIILKVKGAREAKSAVESVFSNTVIGKVTKFTVQTTKAGNATQKMGRQAKNASTQVLTFSKALGRGMATLYLYQRAWNTFGSQFEEGLSLARASDQFQRNVGNVNKMLPELRSATRGVVADFDLLKVAGRAFQQGLKPQQMASTFKMGTIAAQKLGLEATDAINTITNAITRQDEGALNSLGIITNVNQAYKTQAALIAKNGGVMSQAMSIQLRQSLILSELRKRFGGVNQVQEDGLLVLERFRASWKNFRAALGQTIGIAVIPLTKALTGVLEVITGLLNKMNDTGAFRTFIKLAGTLSLIWGASKFITGARTLMGLFGMFGGSKAGKGFGLVSKAIGFMTSSLGRFTKMYNNFVVGLAFRSTILARALAFIPGWGAALAGVIALFGPFTTLITKAWTAAKVFFQLLTNFDPDTGMSKVLKKDADELGSLYNLIENVAKYSLDIMAVLKGLGQGMSEVIAPIASGFSWAVDKVEDFVGWLFQVDKIAVRSQSRLDAITESVKKFTKYIGLAASLVATFIPGLNLVGAAGTLAFGGSIAKDLGVGDKIAGAFGERTQPQPSPQPAMSTQITQPDIRPQNQLPGMDAWTEILTKVNKNIEKQNEMMEMDSQKQEIKDSQRSAQTNVWNRR